MSLLWEANSFERRWDLVLSASDSDSDQVQAETEHLVNETQSTREHRFEIATSSSKVHEVALLN